MDDIATVLSVLTGAELDRIALFVEAMVHGIPGGLSAWLLHLVDHERDSRAGKLYPMWPPNHAIDESEIEAAIGAAFQLRRGAIDRGLVELLDVAMPVIKLMRPGAR